MIFVPWLPSFFRQLHGGTNLTTMLPGWSQAVSSPLLKSLPLVFIKFTLGRITIDDKRLYGFFVAFLFLGFLCLLVKALQKERRKTIQLVILFVVPIILAFITSFFVPVLAPQRVLFALPFFYGLISLGIISLSKRMRWAGIGSVVVISIFSLSLYYTNPRFQREQWRQAVSYVEQEANAESLIIFVFPDTFAPWQWYTTGAVDAIGIAPQFVLEEYDIQRFSSLIQSQNRIFLFQYLTELTDRKEKMRHFLQDVGFVKTQVKDFPGVGFIYTYETFFAQN